MAPFDNALDKLAFANDLKFTKTPDGFYLIEKVVKEAAAKNPNGTQNGNLITSGQNKNAGTNYQIVDGRISIDAQNSPISDLISAISGQLGYNYFLFKLSAVYFGFKEQVFNSVSVRTDNLANYEFVGGAGNAYRAACPVRI